MKHLILLIVLIYPLSLFSAPKFPFPQKNKKYSYGILPTPINDADIQTAYDKFMENFYEESGDKARIKFDDPSFTVSEGIGYGMLITVYMDNDKNKTQDKFDKLWKYYNSYLNTNGLMHWKISGFNGINQQNAATDAELDVAVALIQAYKQWGDQKYFDDATALVDKIWKYEVNANGHLKPGDTWDMKKNPSYFSTAALESFKRVGSQDWQKVITNTYSLLNKVQNSNTGLVPDWCSEDGNPMGDYYYDAARTPWRIAWGYAWFGHNDAKKYCSKVASWIDGKTGGDPTKIVDGYMLDGNDKSQYFNSAFAGAFACAGMADATHQTWLNNAYKAQVGLIETDESYFCTTLKVIYLLLLSGNMPDFWNVSNKYTVTVSSSPENSGTVTLTPAGTEFEEGCTLTVKATPQNNFKFKNWSGDLSGNEESKKVTVTKDMNISAVFEPVISVFFHSEGLNSTPTVSAHFTNTLNEISFTQPKAGRVNVGIYSLSGKCVGTFANGFYKAGRSVINLKSPLSNGIYWVQLECTSGKITRQIIVNR